jgi:uncharacterized YccA/Bax inhibitor family protein
VHHGHLAYLFVSRVFTVTFVGAIVLVMVTVWRKHLSYFTAPLFSIVEGVALGIASAAGNIRFPGVVMQTIGFTIAMSTFLLVAYGFGSLTFGASFTRKLSIAVCGIIAYFAGSLLLAIAGVSHIMIFTTGIRGALVSLAVIAVPGTLLIRTCDAAVQRVGESKPKYMEWYLALGIVVSIVWIYYEMLEMLAKARRSP